MISNFRSWIRYLALVVVLVCFGQPIFALVEYLGGSPTMGWMAMAGLLTAGSAAIWKTRERRR
jgi:hypothetical protein